MVGSSPPTRCQSVADQSVKDLSGVVGWSGEEQQGARPLLVVGGGAVRGSVGGGACLVTVVTNC
eukprot:12475379-Prorocentrum_lima.AAC.1